jgi:hypothetical protein
MYNKQELEDMCKGDTTVTDMNSLQIFENLKNMERFGKYGNADIFFEKDWTKIYEYDKEGEDINFSKLGKAEWDAASETCKIYSSVLIKVIY